MWGDFVGHGVRAFRVAEDLSLADVEDEPFEATGTIGVVHPMLLHEPEVRAWADLFGEYEILPPFDQFDRPSHLPSDEERAHGSLTRWDQTDLDPLRLLGTLGRGAWYRGEPQDGGAVLWWLKPFEGANLTAILSTEPGFYAGSMTDSEEQRITEVQFVEGVHKSHPYRPAAKKLDEVDPIVFSEVVRELLPLFEG